MKKLLVLAALGLAFIAAPASAAVNLGLAPNAKVNFDGNGVFYIPGTFDALGPEAPAPGTQLYGVGTISGLALVSDLGSPIWVPGDVGPNFEMTFTFWNAVVTSGQRVWTGTPGASTALIAAEYADGGRLMLVQDMTKDFSSTGGPGLFDTQDGEYPTVYTLEDAGYDADGSPDGLSLFTYADDPGEEVFLDLELSNCSSVTSWSPTLGFMGGSFSAATIEILGGTGAGQFLDMLGPDGQAHALIFLFQPGSGWTFGADVDVQLQAIPEPSTLVFFGTGLVSLLGYGLRRRMA